MNKEVNELDLELAVRCLGLPERYHVDFGDDIESGVFNLACAGGTEIGGYMGNLEKLRSLLTLMGCKPTLEMTFRIPLNPALEQYLPELKDRYENWVRLHKAMESGQDPFDT